MNKECIKIPSVTVVLGKCPVASLHRAGVGFEQKNTSSEYSQDEVPVLQPPPDGLLFEFP